MPNLLEHRFAIKRITKPSNEDYISALKIYNETTPPDIKTNTNEITYWFEQNRNELPFEIMLFSLYLNNMVVGLAMLTYLKKQKTIIFEYLALQPSFRLNAVFFTYISLLQNYINDSNTDVAYYIIEINNRNKGENIDKESRLFKRLFCLENYGKINALYYSLPLGLYNHESYFESLLYIKTNDNISQISKETYIDLVKAIYFDYYLFWYQPFMSNNEYIEYKKKVERVYQLVIQDVMNEMFCDISYVDCPLFHESGYIQPNTTLPVITRPQKKYLFLVVPGFIACTILIVWIYNTILVWLDIPINHVGAIIGNITSAIIATLSAIYFIKPKS